MPSNNGGYAAPPPPRHFHRFYNPPGIRRQQLLLLQQQHQLQMMHMLQQQQQQQQQGRDDDAPRVVALSIPRPIIDPASSFKVITNLDRFMASVTPFVGAQFLSKGNVRDGRTQEANIHSFFRLEDLWESFREWSAYGAGAPLLLNEKDPVEQYYVPFLSGIQLYVDPTGLSSPVRGLDEEIGAACRFTIDNSTDADDKAKSVMKLNMQRLNILPGDDKSVINPYSCGSYSANSPGKLLFQFLEEELPYNRRPLADKISVLKSQYPELTRCRSCDLLPSSWICVAWYPIYRIPVGSTLHNLGASFLTFHSLSTQFRSKTSPKFHAANTRKVRGIVDPTAKISLPVFALASYKLNGSIMSPSEPHECEQENSLFQAADKWLKHLQVTLFDYKFFRKHYNPRR